ncbi:uncharacterized protein LOC117641272 [Thrips palmi]|uniref:Uncharacterized protein LOC117641272 n=1 Tax=Thrips palmi TaxID=161013 RepID=A0A6P8YC11_THRPL|nr:uncharacterized protein LOC117641272 [Thrips palmi]
MAGRLLMCGALLAVLAVLASTLLVDAGPPPPHKPPPPKAGHHWHMPHPHLPKNWHVPHPHLSPAAHAKLQKIKNCLTSQLKAFPGGAAKVLGVCVPTVTMGPPAFGSCVAGKGIMSAARATSHFAACVG